MSRLLHLNHLGLQLRLMIANHSTIIDKSLLLQHKGGTWRKKLFWH